MTNLAKFVSIRAKARIKMPGDSGSCSGFLQIRTRIGAAFGCLHSDSPLSYFWRTHGGALFTSHTLLFCAPVLQNLPPSACASRKYQNINLAREVGCMEDRTVIISSQELVDHTILVRKKNELVFKRDFLLKTGAKAGDLHLHTIESELVLVDEKLKPLEHKLSELDMVTVLPNRKEIGEFTSEINKFSRPELDLAVKSKGGAAYDLMRKRAVLVKNNYEKREDIARLTIMLNNMPRKDSEALRGLIEEGAGEDADVSFIPKEKQQELLNLTSRLGRQCCVFAGSFSLDKKKIDTSELKPSDEVSRTLPNGRVVWVEASKVFEFDANEKEVAAVLAKMQSKNAEKQAREFNEEETVYLDKLQSDYLAARNRRTTLVKGSELDETAKVYKKKAPDVF